MEYYIFLGKLIVTLATANIICDGNSLTQGTQSNPGKSYPTLLGDSISVYSIDNNGLNGVTGTQMLLDFADSVLTVIDNERDNIYIVWEVTNDIYYGETARNSVNNVWELCGKARNAGCFVIALSVLPRNQIKDDGGSILQFNTEIDSANVFLENEWQSHADIYVDLSQAPELDDATNTSYFPDGIHLNEDGYAIVVHLIKEAINSSEYIQ
jgi:lysophospholipase L1-like esterase